MFASVNVFYYYDTMIAKNNHRKDLFDENGRYDIKC